MACVLCLLTAGATSSGAAPPPARRSPAALEAEARAAAGSQAWALVDAIALPPTATRTATEPSGDGGRLAHPAISVLGLAQAVEATAWATVPEPSSEVLRYLDEHPVAGSEVRDGFPLYGNQPSLETATIIFPSQPSGPISERRGAVTLLALPSGTTAVRVDGVALWVAVPRPIPRGAVLLRVTASPRAGSASKQILNVTAARKIERARTIIDAWPAQRPTLWIRSCPAPHGALTLAFYTRRRARGTPLARIQIVIGGCGSAGEQIRGRPAPSRSPETVSELEELFGLPQG
jgi:hypothetical protein